MRLLLLLAACGTKSPPAAVDPHLDAGADVAVCAADASTFTTAIDNPWLPFPAGAVWVLGGGGERVQVTVLDEVEVVGGVETRVVEEREWADDVLVEVSRNFVAQTAGGTVCYFGEDVDMYDASGEIAGHGGAWRADADGSTPGILMPAQPALGLSYAQEVAPGVAEDTAEITAMGDRVRTAAGEWTETVTVRETSPLDAGASVKKYARGVGMVFDDGIELVSSP